MAGRATSYRSLAALPARQPPLPGLRRSRFPLESLPVVHGVRASTRTCSGRRRASSRPASCGLARARRRTLRRWLDLDEDEFYEAFYCAAMTRCYPGRAPSGRGDRTPTPREQELCSFWRDWELRLLARG